MFSNTVVRFIPLLAAFFVIPFVINTIGKEAYGAWAILGSFIGIAVVFDLGFGITLEKEVARYHAKNESHAVNNFLFSTIPIQLVISLIVVVLIYFALSVIVTFTKMNAETKNIVNGVRHYILLFAFIRYFAGNCMGIVRGLEKHYVLLFINFIYVILYVCLLLYILPKYPDLYGLILSNTIAACFLLLSLVSYLVFELQIDFRLLRIIKFEKSIFAYSMNAFILQLCAMVLCSSGKIILGIVGSLSQVAYYEISMKIFEIIRHVSDSISRVLLPKASALKEKQQDAVLESLIEKGSLHLFAVWGVICVPLIIVLKDFIVLWLGNEFVSVLPIAWILIIASGLIALSRVSLNVFLGIGVIKRYSQIRIFFTLIYIVLAVLLTKYYGAIGLALSLLIYALFSEMFIMQYSFRKFNLSFVKFLSTGFMKLIVMQLFWGGIYAFLYSKMATSYLSILLIVALFNVSYFLGYYLVVLSMEDKKWMNNKISSLVVSKIST